MASLPCSDDVHRKLKVFCAKNRIKMKDFVDKAILLALKKYRGVG
mgnify:CR=1 FL=1